LEVERGFGLPGADAVEVAAAGIDCADATHEQAAYEEAEDAEGDVEGAKAVTEIEVAKSGKEERQASGEGLEGFGTGVAVVGAHGEVAAGLEMQLQKAERRWVWRAGKRWVLLERKRED
jgi:hypothetical protein